MYKIASLLNRIDGNKDIINEYRPLAPQEVKELDAYYRIGFTYSSNALEGNTFDLTETKVLLEDGLTVAGKPLKDSFEVVGHAEAYDYMLKIARADEPFLLEQTVKNLHKLFYYRIDSLTAGEYRQHQVFITGTEYVPPKEMEVPRLMRTLAVELEKMQKDRVHPIRIAAYAHQGLVDIHPFVDGNGRTARLVMNLLLISNGYQLVTIPPVLRSEYYSALAMSQLGKSEKAVPLTRFVAECEIDAQKDYARMFRINLPKATSKEMSVTDWAKAIKGVKEETSNEQDKCASCCQNQRNNKTDRDR